MNFKSITLEWTGNTLIFIDQRKLPVENEMVICRNHDDVYNAIKNMVVRGAPAIGAGAAFGYLLGAMEVDGSNYNELTEHMKSVKEYLGSSRPTAVNLFWALEKMHSKFEKLIKNERNWIEELEKEAISIAREDIEINKKIGKNGEPLLEDGDTVLTHCNAGALATVDYGTALGVIRAAIEKGKKISVYADETRPYLQGARLTTWELMKDNIPVTLITDNMAGWAMKKGLIDAVIVGADRIASNGDTANKIGTYSLAILAKEHNIPFYIAAPLSTIDMSCPDGEHIPIEERDHREITHIKGQQIAPDDVNCYNPAFDVTPGKMIKGIITEKNVAYPPYNESLKTLFKTSE
ncbi:MAG: S-methyl-5-thioribose-1-phosphate isomerase [Thermotogota bacterium]|nr:S-methyl-5-thioribose-1-phosphate isomerase [Thermotogota bacterium]